jgi:hypothetical protein
MRAVVSLVNAVVAIPPCTFVADIALPVASIGEGFADVAEDTGFEPVGWIIVGQ